MRKLAILLLSLSSACWGQESADFRPASTNVWGADYPRVDPTGRLQVGVKAPEATKVKLIFWNGPKLDMVKFGTHEPERIRAGLHRLHGALSEANIEHVFYESPGTDHEWQTWRRDLKDFVPRLFW